MKILDVQIEKQIYIPSLKVRGYIALFVICELDGEKKYYVYDIKTINSWSYKMKFGKAAQANPNIQASIHQELQLGTYGISIQEEFGRCDGLFLLYYNKDNSMIKQLDVDLSRIDTSRDFWERTNKRHELGLPYLEENVAPVMDWECRYCSFKTKCDEDHYNQ